MEEFLKILKQRNKIKPYDYLDRSTYPSNSEQREKLFLEPVNEPAEQILKLDDKETNKKDQRNEENEEKQQKPVQEDSRKNRKKRRRK